MFYLQLRRGGGGQKGYNIDEVERLMNATDTYVERMSRGRSRCLWFVLRVKTQGGRTLGVGRNKVDLNTKFHHRYFEDITIWVQFQNGPKSSILKRLQPSKA